MNIFQSLQVVKLAVDQFKFISFQQPTRTSQELIEGPFFQFRWLKDRVDCNFNGILYHRRNDFVEYLASCLQTRVCIDLNQPRIHIFVDHKVVSQYLKRMLFSTVLKIFSRLDREQDQLTHDWQDLIEKNDVFISMKQIQIPLKFLVSNFVAVFILTVLRCFFLDGIVCEMNIFVGAILEGKFVARCANVPHWVEVGRYQWCSSHQNEAPDIELPSMEQKWTDVLLNNKCSLRVLLFLFLHVFSNLLDFLTNFDPTASVRVFPGFNDPCKLFLFPFGVNFFLKVLYLFEVLLIALNMEGERDIVEDIVIMFLAVVFKVIEQTFFVGEQTMIFNMIMGDFDLPSFFRFKLFNDRFEIIQNVIFFALAFDIKLVLLCQNTFKFLVKKYPSVVPFLHLYSSLCNHRLAYLLGLYLLLLAIQDMCEDLLFRLLSPDQIRLILLFSN